MRINRIIYLVLIILLLSSYSIYHGQNFSLISSLNFEEENSSPRYLNTFDHNTSPKWILEEDFQKEDLAIIEVNKYPDTSPTRKQWHNAWSLYNRSYEVAEDNGWFNRSQALSDGYEKWERHYPNKKYIKNSENLNPNRPEFLIYYKSPENSEKEILAGLMYQTSFIGEEGPQIGGPLTVWHYHYRPNSTCFKDSIYLYRVKDESKCPGEMSTRGPEMIHLWFVNHHRGQFATDMTLEELPTEKPEKLTKKEFKLKMNKTLASDRNFSLSNQ